MPPRLQLFYTLRSPYCYLATARLAALERVHGVEFEIKHVHPLFVRDPGGVFEDVRPRRGTYVTRDVRRISERLRISIRRPSPDPVVQDPHSGAFAAEQPELHLLTRVIHLGVLAAEAGRGMRYLEEVGRLLWSGETVGWHEDQHLGPALARAGLDLASLDRQAVAERERVEARLADNAREQLAVGHWGTPLMVIDGEPFFGQDRIEDFTWRLRSKLAPDFSDAESDDIDALVKRLVATHGEQGVCPAARDWRAILSLGPTPVNVLNLLKFKSRVETPEGVICGADAYARYAAGNARAFGRVGGEVVHFAHVKHSFGLGPLRDWDATILTRYPSARALAAMWLDPEFIAAHVHRSDGVERSHVLIYGG